MEITIQVPDDIAARWKAHGDVSREVRALSSNATEADAIYTPLP